MIVTDYGNGEKIFDYFGKNGAYLDSFSKNDKEFIGRVRKLLGL